MFASAYCSISISRPLRVVVSAACFTSSKRWVSHSPKSRASRAVPTLSLDGGMQFERAALWGARRLTQTLEPRVLYVNTPYRAQDSLPLFDTAAKDFNTISVFSDNAFAGVDRVSDAHQITAGVTTRLIDTANGNEALRLGIAQRYRLREQRITPDGVPLAQST